MGVGRRILREQDAWYAFACSAAYLSLQHSLSRPPPNLCLPPAAKEEFYTCSAFVAEVPSFEERQEAAAEDWPPLTLEQVGSM